MWRHYLGTFLRNLERNRLYSAITIGGIAVGLAACALLLIFVRYQSSFDRWLPGGESIYQVQSEFVGDDNGSPRASKGPWPAAAAFKQDFPQVERATATISGRPVLLRNGAAEYIDNVLVADAEFFRVFELPFVAGDAATALAQPNNIVFTEREALRLFGTTAILGRVLTFQRGETTVERRVTGVLRDLPEQTHLRFNAIIAFDPAVYAQNPEFLRNWGNATGWTYIRLRPGADISQIEAQLPNFVSRHVPPSSETGWQLRLHLAAASEIYLRHSQIAGMRPGGDAGTVWLFTLVAFLILGIATINFTNLATARATRRAREVGIRKAIGARRRQLVMQFLGESMLVAVAGMLIALAAAELLLPAFAAFVDAPLRLTYIGADGILLPMLALTLFVGLLGGLYPALHLSSFRPQQVLKAASVSGVGGSGRLRSILVVAQFAISIGLITCTLVIAAQTRFMRSFDPGYQRDGLLIVKNVRGPRVRAAEQSLRNEIGRIDGVVSLARSNLVPAQDGEMNMPVQVPGRTGMTGVGDYSVDSDFFRTLGIRTIAGRTFATAQAMDDASFDSDPQSPVPDGAAVTARGVNVVISEDAVPLLGFGSPQQAIGQQLGMRLDGDLPMTRATIIGVVGTAQFRSARDQVKPIVYTVRRGAQNAMIIRYSSDNPAAVRDAVGAVWRRLLPEVPLEAEFAEDALARLQQGDDMRGLAFGGFSMLAILLACLGLFSLAAFAAEQRTREIGVRKVFGARTLDIVRLLVRQFTRPVVLANLIAWPVAWWAMRDWLNGFTVRIDLGPGPFVIAGVLALVIAVATVAGHAVRVARANPIIALRYE